MRHGNALKAQNLDGDTPNHGGLKRQHGDIHAEVISPKYYSFGGQNSMS